MFSTRFFCQWYFTQKNKTIEKINIMIPIIKIKDLFVNKEIKMEEVEDETPPNQLPQTIINKLI